MLEVLSYFLLLFTNFFPKLFLKIHKPVFFTIGILSLSLGYVGIVVPGLPTTVFILIAAWAFSKCSTKFTYWIENHRLFGPINYGMSI
ncbi:YbaN family protein [Candidatus Actinomarina sp.]|nr:YbaN family protein [Candidatus Actinomarina sp.]